MGNWKKGVIASFIMLLLLSACVEKNNNLSNEEMKTEEDQVLNVYTTIFPLEDFANKIGGEYVHVTNIVPVGSDAHTFEPTAREMIEVADGDAFIYSGAGLEGFVDALLNTMNKEEIMTVEAAKGIELIEVDEEHDDDHTTDHGDDHEHAKHDVDPHVWLDPILSITLAQSIKDTFVTLMPEQKRLFEVNFEQLKKELEKIDNEFKQMMTDAKKDTFFVSHAGYGYWEDRYGIKQVGISGISSTNEPSQRQLQSMIELAEEKEIKYIMLERNISTKIADVVKNAIGADVLYLHNLEALVNEDVQNEEDYFSLMRKNIEALRIALND